MYDANHLLHRQYQPCHLMDWPPSDSHGTQARCSMQHKATCHKLLPFGDAQRCFSLTLTPLAHAAPSQLSTQPTCQHATLASKMAAPN